MKIAQIGSALEPDLLGGAEVTAKNIHKLLVARGHSVYHCVAYTSEESTKTTRLGGWRPGSPVAALPPLMKAAYYALDLSDIGASHRLASWLSRVQPEAVILHSFRGLGPWVFQALATRPTIIYAHDYALVCISKGMRRRGQRCTSLCVECRLANFFIVHRLLKNIGKYRIIAPSQFMARKLESTLPSCVGENVRVVHNPNTYTVQERQRHARLPLRVGYVGRTDAEKGFDIFLGLVEKFSNDPRVSFASAGGGSLAANAARLMQKVDNYVHLGWLHEDQVADFMAQLDLLHFTPHWEENWPGVVVQAVMAGLPLISCESGGIKEIVPEKGAIMIDTPSVDSSAAALVRILTETTLLSEMSHACLSADRTPLSPEANFRTLLSHISDISGNSA